jgi:hypothetical protein
MNLEHINKYENADMYLSHDQNSEVTTEEVQKAAQDLKYGKASSGPDGILNEMLQITCNINTKVCVCFFNAILKSEIYPDLRRENAITPIFKESVSMTPLIIGELPYLVVSDFYFYNTVNRLDKFLKENNIICSEQIGFKKHCRTSDHILNLKCLIDKAFKLSKLLYVCFIDLRKAFDTVNREALLFKLSHYKLSGCFLICTMKLNTQLNLQKEKEVRFRQKLELNNYVF